MAKMLDAKQTKALVVKQLRDLADDLENDKEACFDYHHKVVAERHELPYKILEIKYTVTSL